MPTFVVWRRVTDEEREKIKKGEMEGKYQFNEVLQDYQVPKEMTDGNV